MFQSSGSLVTHFPDSQCHSKVTADAHPGCPLQLWVWLGKRRATKSSKLPPMLFPQARRVSPRTVLLRRKTTPRDRKMFTTSVAAALIHRALVRKPRKAKSCGGNRDPDGIPASSPAGKFPIFKLGSRYPQPRPGCGVTQRQSTGGGGTQTEERGWI